MATPELVEIPKDDFAHSKTETFSAINAKVPIIFQAALDAGQFAGFADFLILSRSAKNLILLGDQMQLEQPIEGSHPGDAGLSVL